MHSAASRHQATNLDPTSQDQPTSAWPEMPLDGCQRGSYRAKMAAPFSKHISIFRKFSKFFRKLRYVWKMDPSFWLDMTPGDGHLEPSMAELTWAGPVT